MLNFLGARKMGGNHMNFDIIELAQTEVENYAYRVSDEELEKAGTSADAEVAYSMYTSFTPGGCTCVVGV
jgi:hypothetical protein